MANLGQGQLKGARAYQSQKIEDRDALVKDYIGLVKKVALHLKARLPPQVDLDDLIQSGMIGLIDAVQNYKRENAASFETYAMIRIRGEIIDNMRSYDWTPRAVHQNTRAMREVRLRLSHSLGRTPTDMEMATELNVTIERYHQMKEESVRAQVKCLGETGMTDEMIAELPVTDPVTGRPEMGDNPYESIASREFKNDLARFISELPKREQQIISLYYDQELNLREIGLVLSLSESRACQLLSSAQERLRSKMGPLWMNNYKDPKVSSLEMHIAHEDSNKAYAESIAKSRLHYAPRTDLFADMEEIVPANEPAEQEHFEANPSGKKVKIGNLCFDGERSFKCVRDARFNKTLTQLAIDGKLKAPEVEITPSLELPVNRKLKIIYNIHSSRPRFLLKDVHAARLAASKW